MSKSDQKFGNLSWLYPPQGEKGPNRVSMVVAKQTLVGLDQLHITPRGKDGASTANHCKNSSLRPPLSPVFESRRAHHSTNRDTHSFRPPPTSRRRRPHAKKKRRH